MYGNLARVLTALKDAIEDARGYGVFSFFGDIEADVLNATETLKLSKPTEVCNKCRPFRPGMSDQCMVCHTIGMVPKCINDRGT